MASTTFVNGTVIEPAWLNDVNSAVYNAASSISGSSTRTAVSKFSDYLNPKDFGAVGDGTTDDTVAITAAINASATLKRPLIGGDTVYAVSGDLTFTGVSGIDIRGLNLKQLSPNSTTRKTLHFVNCEKLKLYNITVDKNGLGSYGALSTNAAIFVDGGSDHTLVSLESFGNSKGSGIVIRNTTDSYASNLFAHDMEYDDASATDDQVQAIWLDGNTRLTVVGFRVKNLSGNATGQPASRYTRGVACGGNTGCVWMAVNIYDVDQGFDITGSVGNVDCELVGGYIKNALTWGVKLANSAVRCRVSDVTVDGSGIAGFVASGPAESGLTNITMDCEFFNCKSINAGSLGSFAATKAGFRVATAAFNTDYPKGIKFINCLAIDNQGSPTMEYGFHSEVTYDGSSGKYNEIINVRAQGYTTGLSANFVTFNCKVNGTTTQSIPNATPTNVDWDAEVYDTAGMHSTVSNNSNINPVINGLYTIRFNIPFASNSTGYRQVDVLISGGAIPGGSFIVPAVNGVATVVSGSVTTPLVTANSVRLQVYQNSGGALNIDRTTGSFDLELIKEQ